MNLTFKKLITEIDEIEKEMNRRYVGFGDVEDEYEEAEKVTNKGIVSIAINKINTDVEPRGERVYSDDEIVVFEFSDFDDVAEEISIITAPLTTEQAVEEVRSLFSDVISQSDRFDLEDSNDYVIYSRDFL
jgi:hypothetical protein